MTRLQMALVVLAGSTWLVGWNVVVALHYRRVGLPLWYGLRPFGFPFEGFTRKDWRRILIVSTTAIALGLVAALCGD
jgi:hypothetical protein